MRFVNRAAFMYMLDRNCPAQLYAPQLWRGVNVEGTGTDGGGPHPTPICGLFRATPKKPILHIYRH